MSHNSTSPVYHKDPVRVKCAVASRKVKATLNGTPKSSANHWTYNVVILVSVILWPLGFFCILDVLLIDNIDPQAFEVSRVPFVGALTVNHVLAGAERVYDGRLKGAESLVYQNGHIYSGTADGRIIDIYNDTIRTVALLGKPPCGTHAQEVTCGRPLGMRLDHRGNLIVVDSYLGIFRVNVTTGSHERLLNASHLVGGVPSRYLNDLDIASDGTFYITDSSTKWTRAQGMDLILENRANGRVFSFHPDTGHTELLLSDMVAANGIQLSPQEDYLLVTESPRARITKYHLKGSKAGTPELFTRLPGFPDNIRPSQSGGYWVAIAIVNHPDSFVYQYFAKFPRLRNIMAKIFGDLFMLDLIRPVYGLVIELDSRGNIVRSLHDPTGSKVRAVSEVLDLGHELYMGTFFLPYMLRLDMVDS